MPTLDIFLVSQHFPVFFNFIYDLTISLLMSSEIFFLT